MANEKRLIDANALLHDTVWLCGGFVGDPYCDGYMEALDKVETVIREFPTVDAVEVVRCKNCQYWNPRYETMGMCMKHNSIVTFTKPDFYCAFGKGKNDGICKED